MSADNTPLYILFTCCLCLLCLVVLAIVVVVIVMAMRKRKPEAPAPLSPSQPPAYDVNAFIPTDNAPVANKPIVAIPAEEPPAPSAPVEPYAAQTMIGSSPIIIEPTLKETPISAPIPGSIAASSMDIGFDVRDLYMLGFTEEEMRKYKKEEIQAVMDGRFSLADLRRSYQD
jgi:hypothetical protein